MHKECTVYPLCTHCVSTVYPTHDNSIGERRGRHKNKSRRVIKNIEKWNVGVERKSPEQDLAGAEVLMAILLGGVTPPYNKSD